MEKIPLEVKLQKIREIVGGTIIFKIGIRDKKTIDILSVKKYFDNEEIPEEVTMKSPKEISNNKDYIG